MLKRLVTARLDDHQVERFRDDVQLPSAHEVSGIHVAGHVLHRALPHVDVVHFDVAVPGGRVFSFLLYCSEASFVL
jgi:hypothetical protein